MFSIYSAQMNDFRDVLCGNSPVKGKRLLFLVKQ